MTSTQSITPSLLPQDNSLSLSIHLEDILSAAYQMSGSHSPVSPWIFLYHGELSQSFHDRLNTVLHSRMSDRLLYLASKYVPERDLNEIWRFGKGCLESIGETVTDPSITSPSNRIWTVKFRDRSEWFRKLLSDLTFSQRWTDIPTEEKPVRG